MESAMMDSPEKQNMSSLGPGSHKLDVLKEQSDLIEDGKPTRYHLKPTTDCHNESEPYRKITFGERDTNKPLKTILLIGEGGTGKTKLINAMVNYMLGVEREDIWFEITDDQNDRTQAYSQTTIITVYEFYLQESQTDLTIIDTPGYGDLGANNEKEIAVGLLRLSRLDNLVQKVDAVCLVMKATQNRLSERQIYIFDAVQSLFGKDVVENIVLLFTFSHGAHPRNALTAVEEAHFKCAVDEENKPVFFLFDNCQGETFHKEYEIIKAQSWKLSHRGMAGFFTFLNTIKPKKVQMTQDVLQQREQLEERISNIKSHICKIDKKQNELENKKEALETIPNFEYVAEVTYKQKVDIDRSLARVAMCCTICEENCHYPGCWWVNDLSWCSVMKNNHCTVCTNKCHYSKHVKENKIYVTRTKKEKRIKEDLKRQYEDNIRARDSLVTELNDLQQKKLKRVMDAFHCVESLQMIALNTDSLIVLQHIDFLIKLLKEIKEPEKIQTLENIKERAEEKIRKDL